MVQKTPSASLPLLKAWTAYMRLHVVPSVFRQTLRVIQSNFLPSLWSKGTFFCLWAFSSLLFLSYLFNLLTKTPHIPFLRLQKLSFICFNEGQWRWGNTRTGNISTYQTKNLLTHSPRNTLLFWKEILLFIQISPSTSISRMWDLSLFPI